MTTGKKETNVLIPIIGVLWVAGSVAITYTQAANERRDVVMSGVLNGTHLTPAHRAVILENDWIPMVFVSGLSCLVLAAFFAYVPFALRLSISYKALCIFSALIPAVGVWAWWAGGISEYDQMRSILANAAGAPAT